jgi:hypothetical protein
MTAAQLDAYAADLWLLAPPCQPFTRQGAQLGAQDNRSRRCAHQLCLQSNQICCSTVHVLSLGQP